MEITSLQFLAFFLVFLGLYQTQGLNGRRFLLLLSSFTFYGSISFILLGALMLSILINFWIAKSSIKFKNLLAVIFNIGLLLSFKLEPSQFLIPIGVSFFSFQAMSFVFDKQEENSLLNFANYISFFPQLIAGPIETYDFLGPQITSPQKVKFDNLILGLPIVLKGLVYKLVFADRCAEMVDVFYNQPAAFDFWFLLLSNLLFTFQILLDFGGYCLIAVGLAKIIGIQLSNNFNQPYLTLSIAGFWRRWHITLHLWFKKYVYQKLKAHWVIGTLIVFLLSGLWHGLKPHFILWGLVCYLTYLFDKIILQKVKIKWFNWLTTFALISFSWILFRVNNINDLSLILGLSTELNYIKLFIADSFYSLSNFSFSGALNYGGNEIPLTFADWFILAFGLPVLAILTFFKFKTSLITTVLLFLILCLFGYDGTSPFIYLQF